MNPALHGNPLGEARGWLKNSILVAEKLMKFTNKKQNTFSPNMLDEIEAFYNCYSVNPIFDRNYRRYQYEQYINNLNELVCNLRNSIILLKII